MHDAEVIVLLDGAVPPVPAGAVSVAVRERVQVLNGSPVRDGYDSVTSTILGCSEAGGFPQDCGVISGRFGRRVEEERGEKTYSPTSRGSTRLR